MTDLKALRQMLAGQIATRHSEYDGMPMIDFRLQERIEAALSQYAEACLGEPSEGILVDMARAYEKHLDKICASYGHARQDAAKAAYYAMASQRLREIK